MPNTRWLNDIPGHTAWKENMSRVAKRSAERRKCPKCGRKNAVNYHELHYISSTAKDARLYGYRKQCRWCNHIVEEYNHDTGKKYSDSLEEEK